MIRVVVVADSGAVFASLTAAVGTVPGAYIVRHASSSAPLDRVVATLEVDLVLIGDLLLPDDALTRLAEVRRAAPEAKVVMLSSSPEAAWLADALRAQASAVLPGQLEPDTLGLVLREVLETGAAVVPFPERPAGARPATGAAA
jgi:DNA-binding NarL/FixJ family response regulator